ATKLAAAAVEPGRDSDAAKQMDLVGAFAAVESGTVSVNGVDISIDPAADSLLDVLARINASGAGVTASLEESGQRVLINSSQAGTDLVLDGGATGFFVALNITEGTHSEPTGQGTESVLSSIAALSGVQSGILELNGVGIAIDVDADSLEDVVARINDSDSGVTARWSQAGDRLTLFRQGLKNTLAIEEGTTGFFYALGISEGIYRPTKARSGLTNARSRELSEAVKRVADNMNELFSENVLGEARDPALTKFRGEVERTVSQAFKPGTSVLRTQFGVRFDFGAKDGRVFDFNAEDQRRFEDAVRTNYKPVRVFLVGRSSLPDGLVGMLSRLLEKAYIELSAQRRLGLLINAFA
ncbi:MAG: flagellin hook IN motif-containing protein, partial [Pseudomonadales bacterium]